MDHLTATIGAVFFIVVFEIMITYLVFKNKKDLTCHCRHWQSEHHKNFGMGGACYRCDCQIFEEVRDGRIL